MYLHEPIHEAYICGNAAISSHITHSWKQHLLTSDSLYDLSTFTSKRPVILEPKTASHYHDQSLPVIDQSLPGPKFHDQSFANHGVGRVLILSWWIWEILDKYPALVRYYYGGGVSQLTGETKIDYMEYLYSGTM